MLIFFIAIAAFTATMLGGLFALRLRDNLHLILGFSAGALLAVAFFDLMPEALDLAESYGTDNVIATVAAGFLLYLFVDRVLLLHSHSDDQAVESRGHVRAGSLSFHSFLDGIGIGLAFQVSSAVGLFVTAAVLTHDFSDGINTVNVVMRHGASRAKAFRWLVVDALAPVAGIIATLFFGLTAEHLGLLLAMFAGFFLYIGASDLIPESHHAHPTFWTTAMTIVGAIILFVAIRFASI